MRVAILPPKMTATFLLVALFFFAFMISGSRSREKETLIGIVSTVSREVEVMDGFKAGMAEAGYIEGKNLKYRYGNVTIVDEKHIDSAIHELQAHGISLLVSMGTEAVLRAKLFAEETGTPAVFMGVFRPVENGLVESLRYPGGNVTGVRVADSIPKALEWLHRIASNATLVYLPYNPDDFISSGVIAQLETISPRLGIELVVQKVQSAGEAVAAIEKLPEKNSAVFLIPSITLNPKSDELNRAAILRKIPVGAALYTDETPLMIFSTDFFNAGQKASRLAKQILSGTKPADLPVETAETRLILNLRTAEEIGISIPDEILIQADIINR